MKFTLEAIKSIDNLKTFGTIFPCSKYSAKFAINKLNTKNANLIVELGCGTGVFTKEILKRKKKDTKFFGIEINKNLVNVAKKRFPEATIYNDNAENLTQYLSIEKKEKADCILSTLPWATLCYSTQKRILDEIYKNLNDNGEFITIAYLLGNRFKRGKVFHKMLKTKFPYVKKTRIVFKNIPPAFFYHCKKSPYLLKNFNHKPLQQFHYKTENLNI